MSKPPHYKAWQTTILRSLLSWSSPIIIYLYTCAQMTAAAASRTMLYRLALSPLYFHLRTSIYYALTDSDASSYTRNNHRPVIWRNGWLQITSPKLVIQYSYPTKRTNSIFSRRSGIFLILRADMLVPPHTLIVNGKSKIGNIYPLTPINNSIIAKTYQCIYFLIDTTDTSSDFRHSHSSFFYLLRGTICFVPSAICIYLFISFLINNALLSEYWSFLPSSFSLQTDKVSIPRSFE